MAADILERLNNPGKVYPEDSNGDYDLYYAARAEIIRLRYELARVKSESFNEYGSYGENNASLD